MKKIIEYILSLLKRGEETNESIENFILEQDFKWIIDFVQELGFSNILSINNSLNQEFTHQDKAQKILLDIEISPRKREWDVICIQLISNKRDEISLIKKWCVWRSSFHDEDLKKEIRNVSDAFFSVNVSFGDKEPLFFNESLKLEDIYIVPPLASIIYSKKIEDLVIKAFNLGCLGLSNIRPLKIANGLWESFDKDGHAIGGIVWDDQFVGCAQTMPQGQGREERCLMGEGLM